LVSSTYVDPDDPSITYKYYEASTSSLTNEMIATYIMNNESLTELTIKRDGTDTIYQKVNAITSPQTNLFCGTVETSFNKKIQDRIAVEVKNTTTNINTVIYYFNISDLDDGNAQDYFMNLTGADNVSTAQQIKIYKGYTNVPPVISDTYSYLTYGHIFERHNDSYVDISPLHAYEVEGEYYLDRSQGGGGTI